MENKRVIYYIDGFNLYYGLKDKNWKKYYWLDLHKLCNALLSYFPSQEIVKIKYFTARIALPEDKRIRQNSYLQALETLNDVEIIYGKYTENKIVCQYCHTSYIKYSEKMTDVNISVNMLNDAYSNNYDIAYLISADSDLTPVIEKIKNLFTEKKVIVYFPPKRSSINLINICHSNKRIFEKTLKKSQFSEELTNNYNYIIKKPESWK